MERIDGRAPTELRPIQIHPFFLRQPLGSALIEWGQTRVLIAVNLEDRVPAFLQGTGQGWISAEYTLLSRAGGSRVTSSLGGSGAGRAVEIRRLIGRSLRAAIDPFVLGERTLWVDCDVLEADGGTRVAAITGGFVALTLALDRMVRQGLIETWPVRTMIAAISAGIVRDAPLIDLNYFEDSQADVDANFVMTPSGECVEVQLTGEHQTLAPSRLMALLQLAWQGLRQIFQMQIDVLQPHLMPDHAERLHALLTLPEVLP